MTFSFSLVRFTAHALLMSTVPLLGVSTLLGMPSVAQDDSGSVNAAQALNVQSVSERVKQTPCATTPKIKTSPLDLSIQSVSIGTDEEIANALPSTIELIGTWHLTSSNKAFGGLSGLEMTETGDLLAITDKGQFISFGMTETKPNGLGQISPMLMASGKQLTGKQKADAEGLAYQDGVAFVSFERQHRIEAFDVKRCGIGANAIRIVTLPDHIDKKSIKPNNGAEALHIDENGNFIAGYETVIRNHSSRLIVTPDGKSSVSDNKVQTPFGFKLVGESETAILFRAFNPILGNRSHITFKNGREALRLGPPLGVDNFEGITESMTEKGEHILYIISDNNFSKAQRTLLYAFRLKAE